MATLPVEQGRRGLIGLGNMLQSGGAAVVVALDGDVFPHLLGVDGPPVFTGDQGAPIVRGAK